MLWLCICLILVPICILIYWWLEDSHLRLRLSDYFCRFGPKFKEVGGDL